MRFDSAPFFALLTASVLMHRLAPWPLARTMLLVLSYAFYGFDHPWYCLLLLTSTVVDYFVCRALEVQTSRTGRRALVGVSLSVNLGLLLGFKYAGFFVDNLGGLFSALGLETTLPRPSWALPVGISFYTFQTLSYTFDVYYGKVRAERDFGLFGLYVSFFPQLLAGPIERAERLLGQLRRRPQATMSDLDDGLGRVLLGLVKKTVIADRLGMLVDRVYADPGAADGLGLLLATAAFAAQVYLDFSGYCDIAIGSARMLGIRLSENFKAPWLARSPIDFWTRWHITLGTWFRDYVLASLVRRQDPGKVLRIANLLFVFILIGLWHGPSWHFVLFGLVAGGFVASNEALRQFRRIRRTQGRPNPSLAWRMAGYALMAVHAVVLAALFRAPSVEVAGVVLGGILVEPWNPDPTLLPFAVLLASCFLLGAAKALGDVRCPHQEMRSACTKKHPTAAAALRGARLFVLAMAVTHLGVEAGERFIYFQF